MRNILFSKHLGLIAVSTAFLFTAVTSANAADTVKFSRDIRPILADNCYACHGPDAATREEGLRFDVQDGLFGKTESGEELVVPGKPEASELFERITHHNVDDRMPPLESKKTLTQNEIDLVRTWIEEGAKWEGHWAFVKPARPEVPTVSNPSWGENEIDNFIMARLDEAGLEPSPRAAKETLVRRATLDLTGLPPTVAEVDAFLADESSEAYEKVINRLLDSPNYGERMAFIWLDAARYSDTNGYQRDTKRDMWHWRDWVIRAFNDNMPFDQFTIDQLAGDLIPEATLQQKVATGFNRNHRINGEGGIIPEEYAVEYVVDRVTTTSTTWMGMTMVCARCHDHKFDPFSQQEFYKLFAFFNNVPEEGKGREQGNDTPFIAVKTMEQQEREEIIQAKIERLEEELYSPDDRLDTLQATWEQELKSTFAQTNWHVLAPASVSSESAATFETLDDASIFVSGSDAPQDTYEIEFEAFETMRSFRLEFITDERLPDTGPGRGSNGNVILSDFVVERISKDGKSEGLVISDALADYGAPDAQFHIPAAIDDDPSTGWSTGSHRGHEDRAAVFFLEDSSSIQAGDRVTVTLKHESTFPDQVSGRFRLSYSASVSMLQWAQPEFGAWHHVGPLRGTKEQRGDLFASAFDPEEGYDQARTYGPKDIQWQLRDDWTDGKVINFDPTSNAVNYIHRSVQLEAPNTLSLSLGSDDGIKVWVNGDLKLAKNVGRGAAPDQEQLSLSLPQGTHDILIKIVNGGGPTGYYFKAKDDYGKSLIELVAQLDVPTKDRSESDRRLLTQMFRMQDTDWLIENEQLEPLKADLDAIRDSFATTMIMDEMETPRDTYLLRRGVYNNPDTSELLFPDIPATLGVFDDALPKNRLGFAQWLMNPDHPLTARVRVNHYWQTYFGQGIVKTSEDFGTQGSPPTHPKLLDWLALEFIESGWDVKAMQKLIVMSATYQQESKFAGVDVEQDPENLLLARAPRFRLSAEMIRDQALHVSGLINPKVGGPSVKPYQPPNMWSSLSFQNMDEFSTNFYTADEGDKLYRRALYTFWKRTIAPPRMQIFDASDRERCSMRQDKTNTPMQAMVLLNDPTFVEAARNLAQRMLTEGGGTASERTRYGYKLALAYDPDPDRRKIMLKGLNDYRAHFESYPEDATELLSVGASIPDENLDSEELAAYTMLASVILNLDELITRE